MARKKKSEDSPGGANWMDTYGDMVTLLLCFFVLLFSFSNMDAAKFEAMAAGMQSAFSSSSGPQAITIPSLNMQDITQDPMGTLSFNPNANQDEAMLPSEPSGEEGNQDEERLLALAEQMQGFLDASAYGGEVETDTANFVLTIRFSDSVFFDSGSATLRSEAYAALDSVIDLFVRYETVINMIRVEGHTDNRPLAAASAFRDNRQLSDTRAYNAVSYIDSSGRVDPAKLYSAGMGELHPIAANNNPDGTRNEAGMQMNRRVAFVIESINFDALDLLEDGGA
jgi:chemotaxis protein MotB